MTAPYSVSLGDLVYAADSTGINDSAPAFQAAIRAVSGASRHGGQVLVPTGSYRLAAPLTIPSNVTLAGTFAAPPRYWTAPLPQIQGSVLEMDYAGDETAPPLISLGPQATLRGVTIYDRRQTKPGNPVSRPWLIRGGGANNVVTDGIGLSVQDVLLVNPWKGIDLGTYQCGGHYLRGIYGQPLNLGIRVDNSLDPGRIADVHFWEFWSAAATAYTIAHGTAIEFGRADWEMVQGVFGWKYSRGLRFVGGESDMGTSAQFTNIQFDQCDVAIDVNRLGRGGVQISNLLCACFPGMGTTRTPVRLQRASGYIGGPVQIVNATLWGPADLNAQTFPPFGEAICLVDGLGTLLISNSHFHDWATNALLVRNGGRLIASGNLFEDRQSWDRNAVWAQPGAYQTAVLGNLALGNAVRIDTPFGAVAGNL